MPFLTPYFGWIIVALLCTNLIGFGGWWAEHASHKMTKADYVAQEAAEEQANLAKLRRAELINAALVQQVVRVERQLIALEQEKNDEIRNLTTGRRCLDQRVVRVLNGSGYGVSTPVAGPAPTDGPAATDTDVAIWINGCRRAFDTCRGRIDAIADFYMQQDAKK